MCSLADPVLSLRRQIGSGVGFARQKWVGCARQKGVGCARCFCAPSFCVAAWYFWDWAGSGDGLGPAVAPRYFAWQAWHLVTSAVVSRGQAWHLVTSAVVSRGRRGTW